MHTKPIISESLEVATIFRNCLSPSCLRGIPPHIYKICLAIGSQPCMLHDFCGPIQARAANTSAMRTLQVERAWLEDRPPQYSCFISCSSPHQMQLPFEQCGAETRLPMSSLTHLGIRHPTDKRGRHTDDAPQAACLKAIKTSSGALIHPDGVQTIQQFRDNACVEDVQFPCSADTSMSPNSLQNSEVCPGESNLLTQLMVNHAAR